LGGSSLFRKPSSFGEYIYVVFVVAITVALFSATKYILWLYIGAFLLFLQGFFFRKQTKKDIIIDAIGFVLLCLFYTVVEHYF
jgi:hypothetical protein